MLKKCLFTVFCTLLAAKGAYAGFYLAPAALYQQINARHVSFEGVSPRWALGYNTVAGDTFNAGVELFADYPFALINSHRSDSVETLRPKYSVGLSVLPEVILDDYVTGYLRLGGLVTNFPNYNGRRKAFQAGIGLQYRLSMAMSARGEYDYAQYQVTDGIRQPKSNQAMVGLVYSLDCWAQVCNG